MADLGNAMEGGIIVAMWLEGETTVTRFQAYIILKKRLQTKELL